MSKRSNSRFAVLGLIGLEPATPYELVQRMKLGITQGIWPRAESKIYEEPKRLVAEGLARAKRNARSERTRYEITTAGRRWLAEQLAEPNGSFTFESEAALKVLFADHGTRDQLLATIRQMRKERLEVTATAMPRLKAYAEAPTRRQRAHLTALVADLMTRLEDALLEWTDWAESRVEHWDDLGPDQDRADEAVATMHDLVARGEARLQRYGYEGEARARVAPAHARV